MKIFVIFLLVCFCIVGKAQNTYQVGLLPSFNLNKKLNNQWSANLKVESRQLIREGTFNENNQSEYKYQLTDFAFIIAKKVGLSNTLAGGYTLRWRGDQFIHRSIQQFTFVKKYSNFRLAHRLSTDQTFSKFESIEYRLRYRLTIEVPLAGESVDSQEFYLKINNEYLNVLQDKDYDLEIRLAPFLGYKFNDNNKLEFGLDYRLDSFISSASRNRFWMSVNWFIALRNVSAKT